MEQEKNKCPACGQYKMRARRIGPMSIGIFFLFVSALLAPWGAFFAGMFWVFFGGGIIFIVGSVFVKGQVCANCKYSSLHAHA